MGDDHSSAVSRAVGYYRIVLLVIAATGIVVQALAIGPLRDTFWGYHLLAFLPRWWALIGWVTVAFVAARLLFRPDWLRVDFRISNLLDRLSTARAAVLLAAVCAVFFWTLRSNQTMLGDGLPLMIDLPTGQSFHPRQPLAMWVQQGLFRTLANTFAGDGVSPSDIARRTVAVGSVLAGALTALTAMALARSLVLCAGRGPGRKKGVGALAFLGALVLLSQGYSALFYGYIENYTYHVLTIALYLFSAVMYLRRRLPLFVPGVLLVLGIGVHLSTVSLLPSFLYLAFRALVRGERRSDALAGLAAFAVAAVLLDQALRSLSPGYTLWGGIVGIAGVARNTQGGGSGISYMFSWTHVRDFVNQHYLAGPFAAFLFVPALAYAVRRGGHRDAAAVFLSLAAGAYLVGSWATSEPLLGYARDWDLFAPAAVCYTAAGVYFLLSHVSARARAARLLGFALVVSLTHLAPWIWINHSEALTLERFKTLPLGLGRTEVAVGNHYMRQGDAAEAEFWFKRALKVNPNNANACHLLGVLYAANGHIDPACLWFERAVRLRPDQPEFRRKCVTALFEAGRCREAAPHLVWLAWRVPDDYPFWQGACDEMERLGCADEMAGFADPLLEATDRRLRSSPGDIHANTFAGIVLGHLYRHEEALARFMRVLETDPESAAGLANVAMALMRLGRNQEARPYLEKFLRLHPNHPMAGFAREQLGP